MVKRLTNRYEAHPRLREDGDEESAALLGLVQSLGTKCSVFHAISQVPSQGEDLYVLLCDDKLVISFEVPRNMVPMIAQELVQVSASEYRWQIGQGKSRIRLDATLKEARALLDGQTR